MVRRLHSKDYGTVKALPTNFVIARDGLMRMRAPVSSRWTISIGSWAP